MSEEQTPKHVTAILLEASGSATASGSVEFRVVHRGPAILLQSLIIFGAKNDEGTVIQALGIPWRLIARMMKDDPNFLFTIDPWKMEELIAASYKQNGFDVTLTPRSGDLGRDVIAEKKGFVSVRVVDQVKAYSPGHLVDANDVRALLHVLSADRNATNGVVTTTSDFAPKIRDDPFIKPYMPDRLKLINGIQLAQRIQDL